MKNLFKTRLMAFMKAIRIVVTMLLFLTVTSINAQKEQKKETATYYTTNIETIDGITVPYGITVYEARKSKIKFAQEDKEKTDKTRVQTPLYVTKLIYVDKYADGEYDSYFVLRYLKDPSDSFEFKPTKRGFTVEVDKKYVEYIFDEGVYFVNNKDADWFFVEEFDVI
jgi:hypothetical protein